MRRTFVLAAMLTIAGACSERPAPTVVEATTRLSGQAVDLHEDPVLALMLSSAALAEPVRVGSATFGFPIAEQTEWSLSGQAVQVQDPVDAFGPLGTDGCSPYVNAAAVAGRIALIERGICLFVLKAYNAQAAGAIAAIVYNRDGVPGIADMGKPEGDFSDITIPLIAMDRANGLLLRAASPVNVTIQLVRRTAEEQIGDLREDIADLDLQEGTETSLQSKLDNALESLEGGNTEAACGQLNALANQITAQIGKKITAEDAAALLARIEHIRTAAGCT